MEFAKIALATRLTNEIHQRHHYSFVPNSLVPNHANNGVVPELVLYFSLSTTHELFFSRSQPKRGPPQIWRLELLFDAKLEFAKIAVATRLTNEIHQRHHYFFVPNSLVPNNTNNGVVPELVLYFSLSITHESFCRCSQPKRRPPQIWRLELLFNAKLEFAKIALATRLTNDIHQRHHYSFVPNSFVPNHPN
ncbi:MAG: hypothetical protein Q8M16_09010 [Pirellulaceae bacterium]|nr:hypothetical protein [Pirellulaceae bacterium]